MADLPIVQTIEEAKKLDPDQEVLIKVTGDVASSVMWLAKMMRDPDDSEAGRVAKRILTMSNVLKKG